MISGEDFLTTNVGSNGSTFNLQLWKILLVHVLTNGMGFDKFSSLYVAIPTWGQLLPKLTTTWHVERKAALSVGSGGSTFKSDSESGKSSVCLIRQCGGGVSVGRFPSSAG